MKSMAAMRDAKRRAWRPRERRCEDGAVAGGGGRLGGGDAYGKGGGRSICRQPSSVAASAPEPPVFRMMP